MKNKFQNILSNVLIEWIPKHKKQFQKVVDQATKTEWYFSLE
jgi:trans-aconitate methyltransferase